MQELNSGITPFIQKYLRGVNSKPAIAEACMYTMTPDEDFVLDMLPNSSNIAIGAGFSGVCAISLTLCVGCATGQQSCVLASSYIVEFT